MPKSSKLTPKQERFARLLATGEAKNQSEAYVLAYDVESKNKNSIAVSASTIANDPKVALRIESLRNQSATRTIEEHIGAVTGLRDIAVAENQLSAAVKAEELAGRASGLYIERSQHEHVHRVADSDLNKALLDALTSDESMLTTILEMCLSKPELKAKAQLLLSKPEGVQ